MQTPTRHKPKIIVIYGPTATGKTDLTIKLARKLNGEIISADSRQVYKGLDIGSGKVSFTSKVKKFKMHWVVDGVTIHGFDLANPGEQFTVADFLAFANNAVIKITESKKLPIVAGGTGFYIKSLLYGLKSFGIKKDQKLREKLKKLPAEKLFAALLKINKEKAQSLNESDRKNPRRLIRAIEIASASYEPKTANYEPLKADCFLIGLTAPNTYLYKKVDSWLQERLDHGLIGEIERLTKVIDPMWLVSLGLEYKWITLFLKGDISRNDATGRLRGNIHGFIRRQKTWFRQFKNIKMYDISQKGVFEKIEKDVIEFCSTHS